MPSNQNKTLVWQAPEFRYYHKNPGWYVTFFAIAILIVGFFIIQNDIFAAVSLAIVALFALFFSKQKPEIVAIELNSKGIKFGTILYPYKQIKYFWVVHNQTHATVNFTSIAYLNNTIILELGDQDPDEVRDFLLRYLPEHHETTETLTQQISHRLKF